MKPTSLILAATLLMTTTPSLAGDAGRTDLPPAPDAARKPHVVKAPHGAQRVDEYYWLRDDKRKNPEVLAYLNAENAYVDALMAPLKPLENALYDEIVGRIKQDDSSVPYRERGWWYYSRFEAGKDYPIHARRKDAAGVDALSIQKAEIERMNALLANWRSIATARQAYDRVNALLLDDEVYQSQMQLHFAVWRAILPLKIYAAYFRNGKSLSGSSFQVAVLMKVYAHSIKTQVNWAQTDGPH